ncbi:CotJB protein [compost metagenome]|uniref:Spore coat protein CotJB n=1 Tax=Paenibacillus rhizolycopersici TaxID=2780073 RepID=A0ABS2HD60_9BACL|nr:MULTISPECIES: spore coat protein CotJB [Paenibacillus]MBM6997478.1 spore coat protein CotJB [Paenibacillus rhizolycopersici]MBW4838305.1 spore coat protein CotJB [Paenibacillaceae bacterium]MUG87433.1 spore coat protein CotJB [Paenibacillus timonensis]GIP47156.1 spore coat protein CotJB [Paenibacillus sp. J53TS2]
MTTNPNNQPFDQEYYEKLEKLQALDFALVELNLYLDTHPDDLAAIQQFNQLTQERTQHANHFQQLYGPLQNFGRAYSKFPWEWSQSPWPWQV